MSLLRSFRSVIISFVTFRQRCLILISLKILLRRLKLLLYRKLLLLVRLRDECSRWCCNKSYVLVDWCSLCCLLCLGFVLLGNGFVSDLELFIFAFVLKNNVFTNWVHVCLGFIDDVWSSNSQTKKWFLVILSIVVTDVLVVLGLFVRQTTDIGYALSFKRRHILRFSISTLNQLVQLIKLLLVVDISNCSSDIIIWVVDQTLESLQLVLLTCLLVLWCLLSFGTTIFWFWLVLVDLVVQVVLRRILSTTSIWLLVSKLQLSFTAVTSYDVCWYHLARHLLVDLECFQLFTLETEELLWAGDVICCTFSQCFFELLVQDICFRGPFLSSNCSRDLCI